MCHRAVMPRADTAFKMVAETGMKKWSAASVLALAVAFAGGLLEFARLQGWRLRSRVLH